MKIGGVQWTSLIDYPGEVAITIATVGCNFRCKYCHNPFLFNLNQAYDEQELLEELEHRKKIATAVCITGGEPTLQPDLIPFMKKLKSIGYKIKLDTNGSNPEVVKKAIEEGVVDYIAMDVKGPLEKYDEITQVHVDTSKILETMKIIRESGIAYEFRTTAYPELGKEDFMKIRELVRGARKYYIQQFRPETSYQMKHAKPHSIDTLYEFKTIVKGAADTEIRA